MYVRIWGEVFDEEVHGSLKTHILSEHSDQIDFVYVLCMKPIRHHREGDETPR
jgi:hypothetical protein